MPSSEMSELVYDSLSELNSHQALLQSHGLEVGYLELRGIDQLASQIGALKAQIDRLAPPPPDEP